MEGSDSVLDFHQQLFGISKEFWIFGGQQVNFRPFILGCSVGVLAEYPQHLTRSFS